MTAAAPPSSRTILGGATERARRAALLAVAVILGAGFAAPLLWIAISALRPSDDVLRFTSPFQRRTLIPDQLTIANVTELFTGSFLRAIVNSFAVAGVSTAAGVLIAAAAAYAFATVRFPGRGVLFGIVVFSFMIPFEVLAVPLSGAVRDLGLTNSYIALILPGVGNGMAVFLLRQFFLAIPDELAEAAAIDGASWQRVFSQIYLPLSKPPLIAAALMIFLFQWQAYLWPLLVSTDPDYEVGSVALARFFGQSFDADYGLIFAGSAVLALIPAIILLRYQRQFVQSVAATGLKG